MPTPIAITTRTVAVSNANAFMTRCPDHGTNSEGVVPVVYLSRYERTDRSTTVMDRRRCHHGHSR
jgi:hypothetical protein